jgi:hypothetical protein
MQALWRGKAWYSGKESAIYLVHELPIYIVCTTIGFVAVRTLFRGSTVTIAKHKQQITLNVAKGR